MDPPSRSPGLCLVVDVRPADRSLHLRFSCVSGSSAAPCFHLVTESCRSHRLLLHITRVVEWFGLEGTSKPTRFQALPWAGCPSPAQAAQCPIQPGFQFHPERSAIHFLDSQQSVRLFLLTHVRFAASN